MVTFRLSLWVDIELYTFRKGGSSQRTSVSSRLVATRGPSDGPGRSDVADRSNPRESEKVVDTKTLALCTDPQG